MHTPHIIHNSLYKCLLQTKLEKYKPIEKMGPIMSKQFTKGEMQMANNLMRKYSTVLIFKEMKM